MNPIGRIRKKITPKKNKQKELIFVRARKFIKMSEIRSWNIPIFLAQNEGPKASQDGSSPPGWRLRQFNFGRVEFLQTMSGTTHPS